ncbi:MAG TPA: right-handed parallel beta-helix repeat-containing protein [Planctomycetota bacterium]
MLFLLLQIAVAPDPAGRPVLGPAIEKAPDGATLTLAPGVYRETVTIARTLHVKGVEGAVLDPSEPLRAAWVPAPEVGPGVHKFDSKEKPRVLLLDGRIVAEVDPRRAAAEGPWFWKTLLASGPPLGGWKEIRALWTYVGKTAYVRVGGEENPAGRTWTVTWSAEPVVTIRDAAGATLRNVTIRGGFSGVSLSGGKDCVVSGCAIGSYDRTGISVSGGASGVRIEGNRITRGSVENWSPVGASKPNYEIWKIHKSVGYYDRAGIRLFRAGAGTLVKGNHLFETFDGISLGDHAVESLDIPLKSPEDGRGTEISDNLIERTRDSGIELGAGCVDVKVHHNVLRRTHGGLRFKLPRIGPVFIYRNLLEDGQFFNFWFSMDDSPAEGYVYHNTVVGGGPALLYSSLVGPSHGIGAPRWRFYNNLFMSKGYFADHRTGMPVNFTSEHNVVVGGGRPGTPEPGTRYVDDAGPLDEKRRPLPGSPAVDAGRDLSRAFRDGPLPDVEKLRGAAPDAGAHEAVD